MNTNENKNAEGDNADKTNYAHAAYLPILPEVYKYSLVYQDGQPIFREKVKNGRISVGKALVIGFGSLCVIFDDGSILPESVCLPKVEFRITLTGDMAVLDGPKFDNYRGEPELVAQLPKVQELYSKIIQAIQNRQEMDFLEYSVFWASVNIGFVMDVSDRVRN